MAKLTFVFGLCGSGKTYYAERLAAQTGAKVFSDFWRDENTNLSTVLADLNSGIDCIIDEWRYSIPLFRQKILAELKHVSDLNFEWICFENDRASADWNVRHRINKGDVEGHLAINEFLTRVYGCPAEAQLLKITRIDAVAEPSRSRGYLSPRVKMSIFVLVVSLIVLIEGYTMGELGFHWLIPIVAVTAAAVALDRGWLIRRRGSQKVTARKTSDTP